MCTGAFLDAAEEQGFEAPPLLWTFPQPSGLVEQAAYDRVLAMLLEKLQEALPFDGVLLELHGAMVTEGLEDAEGDTSLVCGRSSARISRSSRRSTCMRTSASRWCASPTR